MIMIRNIYLLNILYINELYKLIKNIKNLKISIYYTNNPKLMRFGVMIFQ